MLVSMTCFIRKIGSTSGCYGNDIIEITTCVDVINVVVLIFM